MNISSENYGQMLSIIYESIGQGEQIANNKVADFISIYSCEGKTRMCWWITDA